MSWEDHEPIKHRCPCGNGHYAVIQRSDDWGRLDERWEMQCGTCGGKYGLYSVTFSRNGVHETSSAWVPRAVLQEVAAAELRVEQAKARLTADADKLLGARWRAQFDGKAKKAIWRELTEDGKHYPSLGTFYAHVRDSGMDQVLARYFGWRELPTIVRILGHEASELGTRIAEVERLEGALNEQRSQALRQAVT